MPRYARIAYPHLFYHIINRGLERRKIFKDEPDYLRFLTNLLRYKRKFDWIIYGYCLLPNHFHLLVRIRNDPLAKIMKSLQTAYGVYFNKRYKRVGPVFSGRFKSIIIQKDIYFLQVSKYIHLNPVRVGLTNHPLAYPYSSYPEYIKGKNPALKIPLIDKRAAKTLIGSKRGITKKSIKNYQVFVEEKEDLLSYRPNIEVFGNNQFSTRYRRKFE